MILQTTDTSRDALKAIEADLPPWRERIFEIIATGEGITGREIAFRIHKESGFVSARLRELEDEGRIKRGQKRKDHFTDIDAYPWFARGDEKLSFGGFQKWLHAQGIGNQSFTPTKKVSLYQEYMKSP